ncbi:MAG TPA: GNAT family N-acetyltransferase [Solirubrobacteraceae bacterium]|jgi:predicted GNAT family acetyltransferase|nr:GNAT family N-acetyltransferase [Solirubrobacteraceae bacterium]
MPGVVRDNEREQRFEIELDGELAGILQYRRHPSQIALVHTEIETRFQGRGLASELIGWALDSARAQSLAVLPVCPFVQGYIQEHPDYLDLVPPNRRAHFKLPNSH